MQHEMIGGLWRLIPHEPTLGEIEEDDDAWWNEEQRKVAMWEHQHPEWGVPVPKRMVFCPRGCNCIETTVRYEECAACGATMTENDEPFYDVIEAIQERQIARYEADMRAQQQAEDDAEAAS